MSSALASEGTNAVRSSETRDPSNNDRAHRHLGCCSLDSRLLSGPHKWKQRAHSNRSVHDLVLRRRGDGVRACRYRGPRAQRNEHFP